MDKDIILTNIKEIKKKESDLTIYLIILKFKMDYNLEIILIDKENQKLRS